MWVAIVFGATLLGFVISLVWINDTAYDKAAQKGEEKLQQAQQKWQAQLAETIKAERADEAKIAEQRAKIRLTTMESNLDLSLNDAKRLRLSESKLNDDLRKAKQDGEMAVADTAKARDELRTTKGLLDQAEAAKKAKDEEIAKLKAEIEVLNGAKPAPAPLVPEEMEKAKRKFEFDKKNIEVQIFEAKRNGANVVIRGSVRAKAKRASVVLRQRDNTGYKTVTFAVCDGKNIIASSMRFGDGRWDGWVKTDLIEKADPIDFEVTFAIPANVKKLSAVMIRLEVNDNTSNDIKLEQFPIAE